MSDITAPSSSRRALLAAAIGAAAAGIAQAVGRPLAARAAEGDPVIAGQEVTAGSTTTIRNTTTDSPVFTVYSNGAGVAIAGQSQGSATNGVQGIADGENSSGVWGYSAGGTGVTGFGDHFVGVLGRSTNAIAVYGDSASGGQPAVVARATGGAAGLVAVSGQTLTPIDDAPLDTGVYGYAAGTDGRPASAAVGVLGRSTSGTGVHARANAEGTALRVTGRAAFDRSGTLTLASGTSKASKNVAGLTSASLVFAVVRSGDGDVWVRKVLPSNGSFTVYMNKAVSSSTKVNWIAFG
ncbi:MAG TPA: hypothetical protein VIF84_08895 [Candidatus Limnocylindrales bacterium]|jgi:hypothetical protein